MNELTTAQAIIYGVSGLLLYCFGTIAGKMWSDYRHQYPKQPRQKRNTKYPKEPDFDWNNPINFNAYAVHPKAEEFTDQYGVKWIRRT